MRRDQVDELIDRVIAFPLRFRADTLGRRLGLTEAVRRRLGIRTIGSVDMTTAERQRARKLAARERQRARRRARGAKPRAAYLEANSIKRAKPWEELGISRASWYRRRGISPRLALGAAQLASNPPIPAQRDLSGDALPGRSRIDT
jgi:hypothetical protein